MLPGNEDHNNIRPPTLATLCVHALINAIIVSFVIDNKYLQNYTITMFNLVNVLIHNIS